MPRDLYRAMREYVINCLECQACFPGAVFELIVCDSDDSER